MLISAKARNLPDYIVIGLLISLCLVYRLHCAWGYTHKADAVIIGVMADDIANGRAFPLVYYGQNYMGSIEAWITAPVFALFGPSWFGLSFAPILISCLAVIPFYLLGSSLGGKLSGSVSALLWIFSPFALSFYNISPRGCYPEILAGGATLLWWSVERWKAAVFTTRSFFLMGLLAGILLWTSLFAIPFLATVLLFTLISDKRGFVNKRNFVSLTGFIIGAAPFAAILRVATDDDATGMPTLKGISDRVYIFLETYHNLFSPYLWIPGHQWQNAFDLASTILFTAPILMILALFPLWSRLGDNVKNTAPLFVFILVFMALYLLNERSSSAQVRYLLPLFTAIIPVYSLAISIICGKFPKTGALLIGFVILNAFYSDEVIFSEVRETSDIERKNIGQIVTDLGKAGIKTAVWSGYEISNKINFEAMTRGLELRAMDFEGSRSRIIQSVVEKDMNTGVALPGNVSEHKEVIRSFCGDNFKIDMIAGVEVAHHMRPLPRDGISIPPEEWILTDKTKALGDRRFSTVYNGPDSFVIQLKKAVEISKIRAIFGGRQPKSIAINLSENGVDWIKASPPASPFIFFPSGPSVASRSSVLWEREYQEWRFKPTLASYIMFETESPTDYDIHELFIYKHGDKNDNELELEELLPALKKAGTRTLAANRWYSANLEKKVGEDITLIRPTLLPLDHNSIAKMEMAPGLSALIEDGDADELSARTKNSGLHYTSLALDGYFIVTFLNRGPVLWWTGFTFIDY